MGLRLNRSELCTHLPLQAISLSDLLLNPHRHQIFLYSAISLHHFGLSWLLTSVVQEPLKVSIMSDTFDHNDMAAALDKAAAQAQPAARTEENEANAAKARERGWTAPQGYDYASYNAAPVRGQEDLTEWGHKAAKYEWKDDFGDVGPAVEELEKQLFRSELRMRQGTKLDK